MTGIIEYKRPPQGFKVSTWTVQNRPAIHISGTYEVVLLDWLRERARIERPPFSCRCGHTFTGIKRRVTGQ